MRLHATGWLAGFVVGVLTLGGASLGYADGAAFTSEAYFALRSKLERDKPTELQARKACDRVVGRPAELESWVVEVDKEGNILADMDSDVLSLPDVSLRDVDEDQAARLSKRQRIAYTGRVKSCSWRSFGSRLELVVEGGRIEP